MASTTIQSSIVKWIQRETLQHISTRVDIPKFVCDTFSIKFIEFSAYGGHTVKFRYIAVQCNIVVYTARHNKDNDIVVELKAHPIDRLKGVYCECVIKIAWRYWAFTATKRIYTVVEPLLHCTKTLETCFIAIVSLRIGHG